jgi:hypothetical protein
MKREPRAFVCYASLRDDEVWRAIGQSLPQLLAAAEAMLAEADDAAGQ